MSKQVSKNSDLLSHIRRISNDPLLCQKVSSTLKTLKTMPEVIPFVLSTTSFHDGYIPVEIDEDIDVKTALTTLTAKFELAQAKLTNFSEIVPSESNKTNNDVSTTESYYVNVFVVVMLFFLRYIIPNQIKSVNDMQQISIELVTMLSKVFALASEIYFELANEQYAKSIEAANTEIVSAVASALIGTLSTGLDMKGLLQSDPKAIQDISRHEEQIKKITSDTLEPNETVLKSLKSSFKYDENELSIFKEGQSTPAIEAVKKEYNDKVKLYGDSAESTIKLMSESDDKSSKLNALENHLKEIKTIENEGVSTTKYINTLKTDNEAISKIENGLKNYTVTPIIRKADVADIDLSIENTIINGNNDVSIIKGTTIISLSEGHDMKENSRIEVIAKKMEESGNAYYIDKSNDGGTTDVYAIIKAKKGEEENYYLCRVTGGEAKKFQVCGTLNFEENKKGTFETAYTSSAQNDLYHYKNRGAVKEFYDGLYTSQKIDGENADAHNTTFTNMKSAANDKIAEGFQKFRLANAEHEGLSSYTTKCNEYEHSGNSMGLGATGEINKQVKRLKEKLELSRGMHTTGAALMLTLSRSANSMGEAFSKMQMADSSLLGAIIQQWQTNSNTNVQRMEQLYDSMISKIVQLTTSIFDMLKQSMDAMQQAATIR